MIQHECAKSIDKVSQNALFLQRVAFVRATSMAFFGTP